MSTTRRRKALIVAFALIAALALTLGLGSFAAGVSTPATAAGESSDVQTDDATDGFEVGPIDPDRLVVWFALSPTRDLKKFSIALTGSSNNPNAQLEIDWGDGVVSKVKPGPPGVRWLVSHKYAEEGTRSVTIRQYDGLAPWLTGFHGLDDPSSAVMAGVLYWSDSLTSLRQAFRGDYWGADNSLVYLPQKLPKNVTDLGEMFYSVNSIPKGVLNYWDTSRVTNMSGMFNNCEKCNPEVANWNVSKVTNMAEMFKDAPEFDQPIGGWDVSQVKDFRFAFSNTKLSANLSKWNVSRATDMQSMFANSPANFDPSRWNVSNVTNMKHMFAGANRFNYSLAKWKIGKATDLSYIFSGADSLSNLNYALTLSAWAKLPKLAAKNVEFGGQGRKFAYNDKGMIAADKKLSAAPYHWTFSHEIGLEARFQPDYKPDVISPIRIYALRPGDTYTVPKANGKAELGDYLQGWELDYVVYPPGTVRKMGLKTITYRPSWVKLSEVVSVTFGLAGGKGTGPGTLLIEPGYRFVLPGGSGLTKPGYRFGGWTDGTKNYLGGTVVEMPASAFKLTAIWVK